MLNNGIWLLASANLLSISWGSAFSELLRIMDRIWMLVAVVLLNGIATVGLTLVLTPSVGIAGALVAIGFVTISLWSWLGPLMCRPLLASSLVPEVDSPLAARIDSDE